MVLTKRKADVVALLGLGLLGFGADVFAPGRAAAAPAPGLVKSNEADANGAAGPLDEAGAAAHAKLTSIVHFQGFEDPKTTLIEALDALGKIYEVQFDVNEKAFTAEDVKDVLKAEIAAPNPVPAMKAPLGTVLDKVLLRLPSKSGALVMIRPRGVLEITTQKAVKEELGIPESRPLLPLVYEDFEEKPLAGALRALAGSSGRSIVLDRSAAGDKVAKVTASLHNVPVDTAVKVLADLADLGVVRLDNVFFVTSREKASRLQADPPPVPRGPEKPPEPKPSPEPKKENAKPAP